MMAAMRLAAAVLTITIAGCANDANVVCIGASCPDSRSDRNQPGSYLSAYRQGVWNMATAPGGSCERACCEMPGGEFNIPGVWNERTGVCAWEADVLQLRACEGWCHKEVSRAAEIAKADRLERIEELDQQPGALKNSENAYRQDGVIESRENMGAKFLYLVDMVVPVTVGKDPSLVQTLDLGFGRGGDDPNVIGLYISPKRVKSAGWKYLKCHDVGLSVQDDWSVGGAKGSDGSWLRFESVHDGSVRGDGSTFEMVSVSVDVPTLREWALADESGGQICLDKFSLSPGQKARIVEFLDTPHPADLNSAPHQAAEPTGVLDRETGLVWATDMGAPTAVWDEAKVFCAEYDDGTWRLPTKAELESLRLDANSVSAPYFRPQWQHLTDISGRAYSSEQVSPERVGQPWVMNFRNGHIFNGSGDEARPWCVNDRTSERG